jgi:hypothetical protein
MKTAGPQTPLSDRPGHGLDDFIDFGFQAFDSFGIGQGMASGDSQPIAKAVTGLVLGTLIGATCEGIVTIASVGVAAVPGAIGCGIAGGLVGPAVTNDWSLRWRSNDKILRRKVANTPGPCSEWVASVWAWHCWASYGLDVLAAVLLPFEVVRLRHTDYGS